MASTSGASICGNRKVRLRHEVLGPQIAICSKKFRGLRMLAAARNSSQKIGPVNLQRNGTICQTFRSVSAKVSPDYLVKYVNSSVTLLRYSEVVPYAPFLCIGCYVRSQISKYLNKSHGATLDLVVVRHKKFFKTNVAQHPISEIFTKYGWSVNIL